MEKEFVTYEQAKILHELGFNENCFRGYDFQNGKFFITDRIFDGHFLIFAPLKQQVFRWFREKYNLSVYITNRLHCVHEIESWKCVMDDMFYPLMTYDTYEEAENACIDKLIELVKNK